VNTFPFAGQPIYSGHLGSVNHLTFSPDGKLFASAGSDDCTVRIWHTVSGELLHIFPTFIDFHGPEWLSFSADGKTLLCRDDEGLKSWDVESGAQLGCQLFRWWQSTTFSARGELLAVQRTVADQVRIRIVKAGRSRPKYRFSLQSRDDFISGCPDDFSPDGKTYYVAHSEGLTVLDIATGSEKLLWKRVRDAWIHRVAFGSIDGNDVFLERKSDEFAVRNAHTGKLISKFSTKDTEWKDWSKAVMFHHSPMAAINQFFQGVSVLNLSTGHVAFSLKRKTPWYRSLAVSPDDQLMLVGSDNGTIDVYRTTDWSRVYSLPGCSTEFETLAIDPTGKYLASLPEKGSGFLWDLESLKLVAVSKTCGSKAELLDSIRSTSDPDQEIFSGYRFTVTRPSELPSDFSYLDANLPEFELPNGEILAYYPSLNALRHLEAEDISQSQRAMEGGFTNADQPDDCRYWSLHTLSNNSNWLALADSKSVAIVNTVTREFQEIPYSHDSEPCSISVSDIGPKVAVGFNFGSGRVFVFDFQTNKVTVPMQFGDTTTAVAINADETLVVGGDAYNRWIVISGLNPREEFSPLSDHAGGIRSLAFTPDGKTLVSTARDGQIILWETSTWTRKMTFMAYNKVGAAPIWLAYSPDGKWNGSEMLSKCFTTISASSQSAT
jgi:WD40 repeat protein